MAHTSGVRLLQIHPLPDSDAETDVDIIAIHGLDTKSPDTWIWKSKRPDNNVNWLADRGMLPSRVGQARIFTCDWPSSLFERSDLIQKRIEELARLLLDGIQRRPSATNTYSGGDDRPIVFVASCLGGVILMKALVMADHDYRSLRRATRAIVFLATPFGSTSFQDVAKWVEPGLKVWASIRGQKVSRLLRNVKAPTFDLDELVRGFTEVCREDNLDRVMTFYEMGKTNRYHKVLPSLPILSKQLVDKSSATLQIVPNPLPLDRPHETMNKFPGHEDPDYQKVAGKLEQFLRGIREGTMLSRADAYIRDKHYTRERLKIERLSGDLLPMEQCYINLAIVEKLGENTDRLEEGLGDAHPAARSSPFSIFARQKVETPDPTIQVELATIFNERKRPNGNTIKPRRIMIRGRAGVGKTTLCKKIIHEFCQGTWGGWSKLFHRILWVPLRNLKLQERRQVPGYNHEDLFYHEYFSAQGQDNGRCLARELWRALKHAGSNGSLFILDGLDEISQELEHGDAMSQFLKELLQQPNVIITSRPSTRPPPDMDLELETVGFYSDQVQDYIETAFTDQEKNVTNVKKVDEVRSFIQEHWLIEGLVRIPIQLDALCYTWDGLTPEDMPDTMTSMFRLIELRLWKKDVIRLEKKHDGKLVTPSQVTTSDAEDFVQDEIRFLEGLAFTGLYNNAIDFTSKDREFISMQFKPRGILLDKTLPCLSFVRTPDSSSKIKHQNYHFIHLTFQEYFAARYFIRQWHAGRPLKCLELGCAKIDETEPVRFVQKHKYTARYDIFWRFVAGLLDATQQASPFIDIIEKEPVDLLGPTHQRLVMHCLSEISNDLRVRKNLQARLSQWLLFELDLTGFSFFARESECPEESILAALKTDSGKVRNGVLQALQHRGTNLSDAAIAALTELLKDEDDDVRSAAARALRGQSNLPDAAMTALLQDEDVHIRPAAARALGRQSKLSDATIAALTAPLKDEEWSVRYSAAEALGGQSNLSDAAMTALMALLKDEKWSVRYSAAEALGGQSNLSDAAMTALMALLKDEKWSVRYSAAEALGGQSNLSDAAMTALMALLKDEDVRIRSAAARALGRQSKLSDATIAALTELLKDEEWSIRYSAAEALGGQSNLSDAAIAALTELLKDENVHIRPAAARALGRQSNLSDAAMTALMALLQDEDVHIRPAAARALGGQSNLSEAAMTALMALLKDEDVRIRSAAAEALGGQSNLSDAAIAALTALLKDEEDGQVRSNAATALGGQSNLSDAAIAALTELLKDEEWSVRYSAAEALGGQSNLSDAAIAALTELLKDEDDDVRSAAATALGGQSNLSDAAIAALTELLKDEEWSVRYSAAEALGGQSNLSDAAIAALTELLKDEEWSVRYSAAEALGGQSNLSDAAIAALTELLKDEDDDVRSAAATALGGQSNLSDAAIAALTELLKDEEWSVRYSAAEALGGQSNLSDAAIAALTELLKDEDDDVRSAAARALRGQSNLSDAAMTALMALLKDEDVRIRSAAAKALGGQSNLSDAAIAALTALLKDEDVHIRSAAARALGGQSNLSDAAVGALTELLKDEREDVRSAAAEALDNQSSLSDAAIVTLMPVLQHEDLGVRSSAAQALGGRSNLLDKILGAVGLLLESELPDKSTSNTFCNSQFLKSLYGSLLFRSFREQLSLYVDGDGASCSCIINQPSGLRTASFEESGADDQFRTALGEGWQLWNIRGYKLWNNLEGSVQQPPAGGLGRQPNLSKTATAALAARPQDDWDFRSAAAAEALGTQSSLADKMHRQTLQLQVHKDLAKESLSKNNQEERQTRRQLFHLASGSTYATHESYKERKEEAELAELSAVYAGEPSAAMLFINNPTLYSARINSIENHIFEHSSEFLNILPFGMEDNSSVFHVQTAGSAPYNTTPIDRYTQIRDRVRRELSITSFMIESLDLLESIKFSGTTYNIIVPDPKRDSVLCVIPITRANLCLLEDILQAAVDTVDEQLRDDSNVEWSLIRESLVNVCEAGSFFLKHLRLCIPNYQPLGAQQMDEEDVECLSYLTPISSATTVLFFGLVSYIKSHLGDFEKTLLKAPTNDILIKTMNVSLYLTHQRLACLDTFLGHPVWTFSMAPPADEPKRYYLSTLLADLDDLWGPVNLEFVDGEEDAVAEIGTRGGLIRCFTQKSCLPSLEGEIPCHWQSWSEADVESIEEYTTFSTMKPLLIGAKDKEPVFRVNNRCNCSDTARKHSSKYDKFALNTASASYKPEGRVASVSVTKIFGITIGQTWKVHPATTMKDVIVDDWFTRLGSDLKHDPNPTYLDYHVVIEISGCNGHAQRISFWSMLKNQRLMTHIARILDSEVVDTISRFSHHNMFSRAWNLMSNEDKKKLKRIVRLVLGNLRGTGASSPGLISAWDINVPSSLIRRTWSPSWGSMVKDSPISATLAIMTDACFHYSGFWSCAESSSPRRPATVFYTRLCIKIHFKDDVRSTSGQNSQDELSGSWAKSKQQSVARSEDRIRRFKEVPGEYLMRGAIRDTVRQEAGPSRPAENTRNENVAARRQRYAAARDQYSSGGLTLESELTRLSRQSAQRRQERAIGPRKYPSVRRRLPSNFGQVCSDMGDRMDKNDCGNRKAKSGGGQSSKTPAPLIMSGKTLPFRDGECEIGELQLQTDCNDIKIDLDAWVDAKWQAKSSLWRPIYGLISGFKALDERLEGKWDKWVFGQDVTGERWRVTCVEVINETLEDDEKVLRACIV